MCLSGLAVAELSLFMFFINNLKVPVDNTSHENPSNAILWYGIVQIREKIVENSPHVISFDFAVIILKFHNCLRICERKTKIFSKFIINAKAQENLKNMYV